MVWKERLCALQAPVGFSAVNDQFAPRDYDAGTNEQA
jgi:hypothetical protein